MSPHRSLRLAQRGVALISALLVSALVAALAITLVSRTNLWLNRAQNRQDLASAQWLALGAIDLARLTLRDDGRKNQVDHLQEAWTIPIPAVNAEAGAVGGRIVELQGLFNLANLQTGEQVDAAGIKGFARLLANIGLNPGLATVLDKALRAEIEARKDAGITVAFPYGDLADLAALPGFDAPTRQRLQDVAVILPQVTRLNVNFASADVLSAVFPGLSNSDAAQVVSQRSGSHFASTDAFVQAVPQGARSQISSSAGTVRSSFFMAEVDVAYGRVRLRYQALLKREGSQSPEVVWMRRGQMAG